MFFVNWRLLLGYIQNMAKFSKKEALKFGWAGMKSHFWFFILVLVISYGIQIILRFFSSFRGDNPSVVFYLITGIVSIVIGEFLKTVIDLGFIKICLNIVDKKSVEVADLFKEYKLWWKYVRAVFLYYMINILGLILFIVPGIIWFIRFQYFGYFIVDQGMGPVAALQESWKITRGNVRNLLLFNLLTGLICVLGALALVVGLFAAIPTVMIAQTYVFRKLQSGASGGQTISKAKLYAMAILGVSIIFVVPIGVVGFLGKTISTDSQSIARDAVRVADFTIIGKAIGNVVAKGKPLCPSGLAYCEGFANNDNDNSDGTGWVKIDLTGEMATLPDDRSRYTFSHYYRYCSNGKDWELNTILESKQNLPKMKDDSGDNPNVYEIGSNLNICPIFAPGVNTSPTLQP